MRKSRPSGHGYKNSSSFLHTFLYYILPFIVVNLIIFFLVTSRPKLVIEVGETNDYQSTTVTITVKSILPIKSIETSMEGEEIELQKGSKKQYVASIHKNGALEVLVTGLNGMSRRQFEHISILDDTPPAVKNSSIEGGILTIQFEDSQSGLDYPSIYAVNSLGEQSAPLTTEKTSATVTFTMDSAGLVLHASDLSVNSMQATFTSHKENGKEILTDETDLESSSQQSAEEESAAGTAEEESTSQ